MVTPRALTRVVLMLLAILFLHAAVPVGAQDFVPAVVFDMGGKFDKSFNEAAYQGAERFKKETGIAYDKATGLFYLTGKRWRTIFVGRFAAQK